MTMTEPTTTPSGSEYRVVTVADLRHELQREHLIINAHIQTISNQITALDLRFGDFREVIERRFAEAKDNTDQQFTAVDQRFTDMQHHMDQRFNAVDQRFDQMEKLFVQVGRRFDALDERLRFNKTLVVASVSAVASAASVVVSLLR